MKVQLLINSTTNENTRYLGWARTKCEVRLTPEAGEQIPGNILFRSMEGATGGRIIFLETPDGTEHDELTIAIPAGNTSATVYLAGKYPHFSKGEKDVKVEVVNPVTGTVLHAEDFMVRVRRNANKMVKKEREYFLKAFAEVNTNGRFADFRKVHSREWGLSGPTSEGDKYYFQAHGHLGFLPWHRAFLLDLEREMQLIDARVSLPYWKFDDVADGIFTRHFMGEHVGAGSKAVFADDNPLFWWGVDGSKINRTVDFNVATEAARTSDNEKVLNEKSIVENIDTTTFLRLASMEGRPHATAHNSFGGDLTQTTNSVRDPMFFLLHCNIDRIWGKWQDRNNRFNKNDEATYPQGTTYPDGSSIPAGHKVNDTMWPWNGATGNTRPREAPGSALAPSAIVTAPGNTPKVSSMIDWQGRLDINNQLGFDYDDVAYPVPEQPVADFTETFTTFAQPEGAFTISKLMDTELLTSEVKPQALSVVANTNEDTELRKQVIQKSGASIRNDEDFIESLLNILENINEPANLRLSALLKLQQLTISSIKIIPLQTRYTNVLRGLVTAADEKLRHRVINTLAIQKDSYTQSKLKEGLENPGLALIPPQDAIRLLGYDIHADIYALLRTIVSNPPNEEAKAEAIELLGHDANSVELLSSLLSDTTESAAIRKAAAKGLQLADIELFNIQAKQVVQNDDEDNSLRTVMLNGLSFNTGMPSVKADDVFAEKVKAIAGTTQSAQLQNVTDRFLRNMA